jgi:hypothetical protein
MYARVTTFRMNTENSDYCLTSVSRDCAYNACSRTNNSLREWFAADAERYEFE